MSKKRDDSRVAAGEDLTKSESDARESSTAIQPQRRASLSGPVPEQSPPPAASSPSAVKRAFAKPLQVAVQRMQQMSVGVADSAASASASSRDGEPLLNLGEMRPDYTLGRGAGPARASDAALNNENAASNADAQQNKNAFVRAMCNGLAYVKAVFHNNKRYQMLVNCYTWIVILQFLQFAVILLFYGSFTRSSDDSENVTNYLQGSTVFGMNFYLLEHLTSTDNPNS